MSQTLRFTLLGSPRLMVGDHVLTDFTTTKAQALLFYLAVTAHTAPHSRDSLAMLLWGEMTDAQARQNLRTMLSDLRRLVGDYLQIERQTVAFKASMSHWLDVDVLRRDLTPGWSPVDLVTRQAAVDLYAGEFLSGFYVHNAPAFETWVIEQREQIHIRVVETLFGLVRAYIERADYVRALAANRRLLVLEPWSEPAHRQQMLILDQTGERSAALAQYDTCRRILLAEFGVEPLPETTALYEQIRTGSRTVQVQAARPMPETERAHAVGAPASIRGSYPGDVIGPAEMRSGTELPDQIVGHGLPRRIELYDRQAELGLLHQWMLADGCRVVGIFGIGGQGKTALAAAFAQELVKAFGRAPSQRRAKVQEQPFTRILWRSLVNAPPLAEVLHEWLSVISDQQVPTLPASQDQQLALLLDYLRQQRCLLILDNLESVLQSGERSGAYRPDYEGYGQLIRRLAEGEHRSCLLLTSRERPQDPTRLLGDTAAIRELPLAGLPADAGRRMLQARGLAGASAELGELVQHYSGNPLGLQLVAETIRSIFAGDVHAFLQAETLVFDDIRDVLDQQFARLSPLECDVMLWLAVVREPVSFISIRDLLGQPPASRPLLEAVRSLQRRSLLEQYEAGFGLQNVVLEYATDLLIEHISGELVGNQTTRWHTDTLPRTSDTAVTLSPPHPVALSHLNRYALILAQAKEYVRASQTRLLLQPVADALVQRWGHTGVARQLHQVLGNLRTTTLAPGYAAANLLHLLLHLGVDLRGADFSGLSFQQLYLRGVSLPAANFAQAALIESAFTEPFGMVYTATFSPDGAYLAAGTTEGDIYLWRTADQQLERVIQAHRQSVTELVFGQRFAAAGGLETVLASVSGDASVGIWSLDQRAEERYAVRLTHPLQGTLIAVCFHAAGRRLASVTDSGDVFVWDVSKPTDTRLVHHFATMLVPHLRLVAFSADGQTVAVGSREGIVQVWDVATGTPGVRIEIPTGAITSVALRGDGSMLASGGRAGHLCLWQLPEGHLHQMIETKAGAIDALAFHHAGDMLASTHGDRAVRVWAIDAQECAHLRHTMLGHTIVIRSVVFGSQRATGAEGQSAGDRPQTRHLLVSGSSDQTVRVWDAATGQAFYTLRGQPRALSAIAIARAPQAQPARTPSAAGPDWLLIAAGYTQQVHRWQGRGTQVEQHSSLRGQRGPLFSVALRADGHLVAGGGADKTVCVWNSISGQLLHTFYGHTNSILCVAFQPGGDWLASGSSDGTVRLWSLIGVRRDLEPPLDGSGMDHLVAVLPANAQYVYAIAFSPDGRVLASVGRGLMVRLWDLTQPAIPELVTARKTVQTADEEDITAVAFSPDGSLLACGGYHIHLWDLTHESGAEMKLKAQSASRMGEVSTPRVLRQHTNSIFSLAFSPDGATLASGSADRTACLWDVASGGLRAILRGHTDRIFGVAFSPDGAVVLGCSADGTINVWDSQSGAHVTTIRVEAPYTGMNIRGVTGISEAQKAALKALGAMEGAHNPS